MKQTDNNRDESAATQADFAEVLEVAAKAGHILLENGAEISRVEDIMSRIASHFGVDSGNFFVLSNGIFTTGRARRHRPMPTSSSFHCEAFSSRRWWR